MVTSLQKKEKLPAAQRKSAEYYACLRRKNGFAFLSHYVELKLNICSFVLGIYFQFKFLFVNFFEKRRLLAASRRRKKTH